MNKILIVASSEFGTLVRSKAFIISLVLMPVIMVGSILLVRATRDTRDDRPRRFAYVDHSGVIGAYLESAAAARNADPSAGAPFHPVAVDPMSAPEDELRIQLSDRIRSKELFAFVEIPADVVDPAATDDVRYYSAHPGYQPLPQWLRLAINEAVLGRRFQDAAVDPQLVSRLMRPAAINKLGLFERDQEGGLKAAEEVDEIRTYAVPGFMLILMYITVMSSAPQLLNSVIEEKMSRISEVLIGSVTPFELMMGKLLGCVSVSLVLSLIYGVGGALVAQYYGYLGALTLQAAGWFLLYLVMAVLIFGSLFVAIGAACTDLKDSQNMMTPVMVLIVLPLVTWAGVIRAPDSTTSTVLSLIPTATPFLMLLRISIPPGPPLWQILLSVLLAGFTTLVVVWGAGRIFRTGLLMQGKSATLGEMIRWVRAG